MTTYSQEKSKTFKIILVTPVIYSQSWKAMKLLGIAFVYCRILYCCRNIAIVQYWNIAILHLFIVRYYIAVHNNEIVQYWICLLQDIILLIAETKSRNLLGSINKREPWWLWFIEHHHHHHHHQHHHHIIIINNSIIIIKREQNGCGS